MHTEAPDTVCAAFQRTRTIDPRATAVRTPGDSIAVSWAEYDRRVRAVAEGLHAHGVRRGDVVALMMGNRPEFAWIDSGAMHLGATTLSVYNTSSPEQLAYVLGHAGARVIICERAMVDTITRSGADLAHIVTVDGPHPSADLTLDLLESACSAGFDFDTAWRAVRPDDIATLVYTSGTTGNPKGVPITHSTILAAARGIDEVVPMRFGDRIISFLPAAHIADRVSTLYWMAVHGLQVTYLDDPKSLLPALRDTRPTLWFAVPRIWEKFRAFVEASIDAESDADTRNTLRRAIEFGRERHRAQRNGIEPSVVDTTESDRLDAALRSVRATLGLDRARVSICGSAPIAPGLLEYFAALGVPVAEVWGMTETAGIGTINPPSATRLGSVGKVLPGNEVRLDHDGELLIRGPVCFGGYRAAPELTATAIDAGGWVRTGDIATIDADGYVRIIDRKKDILINAAGKNMSPSNIENTVKSACSLIGSIAVIGDARPYNVALITLDPDAAAAAARRLGLADLSVAALAEDPRIRGLVAAGIERGNASLARVEQVKRHQILGTVWEPGGEELTPTMKIRRKPIGQRYAHVIEALYATGG
ncbi:long-chain fatty acid--CoA ligase [Nocardia sp. NPDC050718]|uniref:AMP-dependent synthetase/ligase n=1 Tax=Nocardia sp. NPDC050718 TaxID=3155788 RepID=UPI0033CEAE81